MLHAGGLIAYPTEAVYGLGCDPRNQQAVARLLHLKQRPWQKGMILIAASVEQLQPYIQPIDPRYQPQLDATWPGPNTWLVPASESCPAWICGTHTTVAVRVTAHPLVQALCTVFGGALVSTSANRAGRRPAKNALRVLRALGDEVDYCLHGELGGAARPTVIRDLLGGDVIRGG
ncbi:MAG: Sua5/YciO/YrdC/YwlC family protein [Gammaproteobacteria bacterium]|nr:Sua5/YciO/YrdC/YwlC family protein [Gammaproteobacteria bacterium]